MVWSLINEIHNLKTSGMVVVSLLSAWLGGGGEEGEDIDYLCLVVCLCNVCLLQRRMFSREVFWWAVLGRSATTFFILYILYEDSHVSCDNIGFWIHVKL